MLTAMAPTLQDTDLDGMAGLFKMVAQNIPAMIQETAKLELGLNIEK